MQLKVVLLYQSEFFKEMMLYVRRSKTLLRKPLKNLSEIGPPDPFTKFLNLYLRTKDETIVYKPKSYMSPKKTY